MKVLLISANTVTAPYPVYPLGLDYVAGALKGRHEVKIVDLIEYDDEDSTVFLKQVLEQFAPDLVGISIRNIDNTDYANSRHYVSHYQKLAAWLRRHTQAPMIAGGSGFSIFPEQLMQLLGLDYGIVGEGERLAQLIDALADGYPPEDIPGVILPNQRVILPADGITMPVRSFEPLRPHVAYYLKHGGMLNLQTKRGCPFGCIYCTYPHIEGPRLRLVPPAEVAREALALQEAGARYFFITDSAFNADQAHSLEVAQCFREVGVQIPWGAYFVPLRPPAGYFAALASAGLSHVEFGAEAMSNRVLQAYGKPYQAQDVHKAHAQASEAGLHIAHFMLAGGPGETAGTLEETLLNVDKLARCVLFFFCGMRVYPYTRLHRMLLQEGHISHDQDLLAEYFYQPPGISLETIENTIRAHAAGRKNWIVGSGGEAAAAIVQKMYRRGYSGPMWEFLI